MVGGCPDAASKFLNSPNFPDRAIPEYLDGQMGTLMAEFLPPFLQQAAYLHLI